MTRHLPLEVISQVIAHLEFDELKRARLSCTALRDLVSPILFDSLSVMFFDISTHSRGRRRLALLKAIAKQTTTVGKYVRALAIVYPFETSKPDSRVARLILRFWHRVTSGQDRLCSQVMTWLLHASSHLVSLRSIHWGSYDTIAR
ncbi:hypothetical protein CPB85DRAFT_453861 [Mucidula mucida]|nr:hypothetical protein CPB85DRAFT_453861 [Mucidula mucida]